MHCKRTALAVLATMALAACATTTSPTGRSQYLAYSDSQLDQMGAQAFTEMKTRQKTVSGGQQNSYVQCVVNALIAQLPPEWRGKRWETAVFQDDTPNAFALPGGKVGVNTGMFKVAKNQDQLAAVIGHEIGHVYARHTNERVSRQAYTSMGLAVAGAAHGHTTVLIVGLVLSIALMGLASTWIARVINRYPWIACQLHRLAHRLEAERPTLGVCFGAQMIAPAFGEQRLFDAACAYQARTAFHRARPKED